MEPVRGYRPESWIDPRLEVRDSPMEGRGMFAGSEIRRGEVVVVWGGTVFTWDEVWEGKTKPHSVTRR